jgi:Flp pilus assembly protein TadD
MPRPAPRHEVDPVRTLRHRATRLVRKGEVRKAVLALREAAALDPSGANLVRLSHALLLAERRDEALHALRQALYCFRHDAQRGRARTVASLILKLDPADANARRRAA